MGSGKKQTQKERLFGQLSSVLKMVADGARTPQEVSHALQSVINTSKKDEDAIRTYWERRWHDFGIKFDPAGVRIPPPQGDFNGVIMMPRGLRQNALWEICESVFSEACLSKERDLDKFVSHHDRFPLTRSYAIRVRNRLEAEEEFSKRSANQLFEAKFSIITLPERLVRELDYFTATGGHLDIHHITLCAGSRCLDGDVPEVYMDRGVLHVQWCGPDNALNELRACAVVV